MIASLLVNIALYSSLLGVYIIVVFFIAELRKDNSVMDIAYGPAFLVSALGTLWVTGIVSPLPILISILIGIWSIRLATRIFRKNYGKSEDARYAAWRSEWMKRGYSYFMIRSFLQINLLQGSIILLVSLPFLIAVSAPTSIDPLYLGLGLLVYLTGLMIEAIADYQLDQFLTRKRAGTEPAVLMTTGLFAYARRPNYFGETLIWWGLALMVFPLPLGHYAVISPLLITYIVTRVTGPMLERIFLEKYPVEYRTYMKTTNYFFPGPKKRGN